MASKYRWRDSPDILARLVDANNINTWKSQEVVIKPNEAVAFIVDGRIGDIITEKIISNIGGGFARFLGEKMGVTAKDRRLLFAMTGPADISVPFEANMSSGQNVSGFVNVRVQIRTDDVPKLINYFTNNPPQLNRKTLAKILHNELTHRVINPSVAECANADDLRNAEFQNKFEMRTEVELRPTLSTLGFTLLKAFISTNQTDSEKILALRAELDAATQTEGAHAEALMEKIAIREAATLRRIECEVNVAKAKAAGKVAVEIESELKELRKQEALWEAEHKRDSAKADLRMKESSHKTEQAMALFEQVQDRKRDRMKQQFDHQNQRMSAQNEIQMKIMEMAAENDALTPELLQEFLKQQTAQKAVDGSGIESDNNNTKANNENKCPNCSNTVKNEWKACPHCGTSL